MNFGVPLKPLSSIIRLLICFCDLLLVMLYLVLKHLLLSFSRVSKLTGAHIFQLTKRLNELDTNDIGVQANLEKRIVIPPLPFDLASIEQLIQDTKVTPLDSK